MEHDKASGPADDVLLVHGATENGESFRVIRKRGDAIELGELRPAVEGKPITGELVSLTPRVENPHLFNVDVLVPRPPALAAKAAAPAVAHDEVRKGPARVATEQYRMNWESIFGSSKRDLN